MPTWAKVLIAVVGALIVIVIVIAFVVAISVFVNSGTKDAER